MMNFRKKLILFFCMLSFIFFLIGFFSPGQSEHHEISQLGFNDALFIFIFNSINLLIWFMLSLTGLSPLLILKAIFGMGTGWHALSISPLLYYSTSFSHGVLEWIACLIVFLFTIDHLYHLTSYFRKKISYEQLKSFYWVTVKKTIPTALFILFAAAFFEVYVSNRLLLILVQ
ncbi:hypothetical protein [Paenibacillus sp. Leaf72]|uniref:hypothetical protein n=1 Tax=Paenibacillus sp. Leaf72 TaxID=1736234 RepID=UPI0006F62E89|nr:hypothetical protein [Paenibacillus sp. Leaf72]KQO17844.1 hypothetical protein ASF12_04085 [Paenibacillus sp. Leaf72]